MAMLKAYLGTLICFLVIDALWIGLVAGNIYQKEIGTLMRTTPEIVPAAGFYLLYVAGIVFLAVRPALSSASLSTALVHGAALGALAYGTFTVTNFSILKDWTWTLVWSDIAWGTFLTAVTATVGYLCAR